MIDRIKKNKVFLIIYVVVIIALALMTQFDNKYLAIHNNTNPYEGVSESNQSMMKVVAGDPVLQYSYFVFNIVASSILILVAIIITNNKNNTLKLKWIISLALIILYAFTKWGVRRYVGVEMENREETYRAYIGASVATLLFIISAIRYTISRPKEVKENIEEKK